MNVPLYHIDAFTDRPFSGNPAAVCLLPGPADALWMQRVAAEMNLSETAFLWREAEDFRLRWFTPTIEVDLCGHATLAAAHLLWEAGELPPEVPARFDTRSGLLTAMRKGNWIELDFPSEPALPASAPEGLIEALGVMPQYVGRNRFDYLVEVDSEETVRGLAPDLPRLAKVSARGVMVTSRSSYPQYDFVSRFFAPASGIDEDPVTGSAHCCLGPFWRERLHKDELVGYQASARGGIVRVRPAGERIYLNGQAVTVFRGTLVAAQ
jgi:PhzF family phenazine biosynthesis protein